MKDVLKYLARSLVSHPDSVTVTEEKTSDGLIVLELTVHQEDMGKIIGKGGKIIKAIRDLVRVVAIKQGKRVRVNLTEQQPSSSTEE